MTQALHSQGKRDVSTVIDILKQIAQRFMPLSSYRKFIVNSVP